MKLLDQLELAGFISAQLAEDGTITVTIQAGTADPRPALEAAKADGRGTRLGSVQQVVLTLLNDADGVLNIQAVYDRAAPLLSVPLKRDTRMQQIRRALEKLAERGLIAINEDYVSLVFVKLAGT